MGRVVVVRKVSKLGSGLEVARKSNDARSGEPLARGPITLSLPIRVIVVVHFFLPRVPIPSLSLPCSLACVCQGSSSD